MVLVLARGRRRGQQSSSSAFGAIPPGRQTSRCAWPCLVEELMHARIGEGDQLMTLVPL